MNILDVISRLNLDDKALQDTPDWAGIASYFNIPLDYSEDSRLVAYFLTPWYCTDSYVGMRAYFLDGAFIGTSMQRGRKWHQDFLFCPSSIEKVRNYLRSLVPEDNSEVPILNLNEDIGDDYYTVEFGSQLLTQFHKFAIYEGREVTVEKIDRGYDCFHIVEIKDGEKFKYVDVRNLKFKAGVSYGLNHKFGKIKLTKEEQKAYEIQD